MPTTCATIHNALLAPEEHDTPDPTEVTLSVPRNLEHNEESEPSVTNDNDNDPLTPWAECDLIPVHLLKQIIKANKCLEMVKPCDPDTFYGLDAKKLKSFLIQCQLNFLDQLRAFRSDT